MIKENCRLINTSQSDEVYNGLIDTILFSWMTNMEILIL